jgi:hypothetical protein
VSDFKYDISIAYKTIMYIAANQNICGKMWKKYCWSAENAKSVAPYVLHLLDLSLSALFELNCPSILSENNFYSLMTKLFFV